MSGRRLKTACAGIAIWFFVLSTGGAAHAQNTTDAQIRALQEQVNQLQRALDALRAAQEQSAAQARAAQQKADEAAAQASQAKAAAAAQAQGRGALGEVDANGHGFFEHKPGSALTFFTPGGEITGYGNIDVSLDVTTKNFDGRPVDAAGVKPLGNWGWMPAISTNLSYVGVRGFQRLGGYPFQFVYQLEAGFDVSATPGTKETNSNQSNTVTGGLFSRNSYIGLASPAWGAVKIGKTDAPYKNSTAALNPFSGEIGDYAVVMGNTGGDNRVEFGTRLDHAIWYESPVFGGGLAFNVLFAPGQNRASNSDNIGAGESDCAGGNVPGSGGTFPVACNDGSFSDAVSSSLSYTRGPLYLAAAYEFHHAVNRQSDITGIFGATSLPLPTATAQMLFDQDVADEHAAKVAALYSFPTGTSVGGIVEYLRRDVPGDLRFQNERQRFGTWLMLGQQLTPADGIYFGWAHAFHTPGDPGQHNDATLTTPDGAGAFAPNNNSADMLTLAYKHLITSNLTWYADVAATLNGPAAHFDLGAGGRGVTTDCHDATGSSGGLVSTPRCWTGQTLMGVSTGLQWRF